MVPIPGRPCGQRRRTQPFHGKFCQLMGSSSWLCAWSSRLYFAYLLFSRRFFLMALLDHLQLDGIFQYSPFLAVHTTVFGRQFSLLAWCQSEFEPRCWHELARSQVRCGISPGIWKDLRQIPNRKQLLTRRICNRSLKGSSWDFLRMKWVCTWPEAAPLWSHPHSQPRIWHAHLQTQCWVITPWVNDCCIPFCHLVPHASCYLVLSVSRCSLSFSRSILTFVGVCTCSNQYPISKTRCWALE